MDAFFEDVDPSLVDVIKEVAPEPALREMIKTYSGPDSKEAHVQAVIPLLKKTAEEKERSAGPGSEERKQAIKAIGYVYVSLHDWPAAASTWRLILDEDDKDTLDDHPNRDLAVMFNLGLALNHANQYPEAETVLKRLLPMLAAAPKLGKSSQQYVGTLGALMMAVGKQGKVDEARKVYSEHAGIIKGYDESEYKAHADYAKVILDEIEHEAREG